VTYGQVDEDCFTTESSCTVGAQFPSNENALAERQLSRSHLNRLVVGVCDATTLVGIIYQLLFWWRFIQITWTAWISSSASQEN